MLLDFVAQQMLMFEGLVHQGSTCKKSENDTNYDSKSHLDDVVLSISKAFDRKMPDAF